MSRNSQVVLASQILKLEELIDELPSLDLKLGSIANKNQLRELQNCQYRVVTAYKILYDVQVDSMKEFIVKLRQFVDNATTVTTLATSVRTPDEFSPNEELSHDSNGSA